MAYIQGLTTASIRDANASMALAFRKVRRKYIWPIICNSTRSSRFVEPYAFNGAMPPPLRWNGALPSSNLNSFSLNTPNFLFKTPLMKIRRNQIEFDQTGSTRNQFIADTGVSMLDVYDLLFCKRILAGGTAASATAVGIDGVTYNTTFEPGIPFFSTSHNWYKSQLQSNVIQGNLPYPLVAGTYSNAQLANALALDVGLLIDRISGMLDDKGVQLYPNFDPENQLHVFVQPVLRQAAELALGTRGSIIGAGAGTGVGGGAAAGATTNIAYRYVKSLTSPGYLGASGVVDVEQEVPSDVTTPPLRVYPDYPGTQWWAYIEDPRGLRAMTRQVFIPKKNSEVFPLNWKESGYDPEAVIAAVSSPEGKNLMLDIPTAEAYSAMEVDYNFGAVGSNAQESVVTGEYFFASARAWLNFAYGPAWLGYTVVPAGQSVP